MTEPASLSILFLGPQTPLAAHLESWLTAHLQSPFTVHLAHRLPDALEYLRAQPIDLALLDLSWQGLSNRDSLQALRTASPASALLALIPESDETRARDALQRGAHEVLATGSSSQTDASRTIARALARTGKPWRTIMRPTTGQATPPDTARLIHDLNNVMTSINGFADLLLARLSPQDPARRSAEHIRTAGKRAADLLKAHTPASGDTAPSPTAPSTTIIAKAA